MTIWQIIQAILLYAWLFGVLVLLWRIAFNGHIKAVQDLLQETTRQNLEMAHLAADASTKAAHAAELIAAYLEKPPHAAL